MGLMVDILLSPSTMVWTSFGKPLISTSLCSLVASCRYTAAAQASGRPISSVTMAATPSACEMKGEPS